MATVKFADAGMIGKIMDRIESLPVNGDAMITFGPQAEKIELDFQGATEIQTIKIYEKKFKTPSTGFHSLTSPIEQSLYSDIEALVSPALGKVFLKIQGLELKFDEFSLVYKGDQSQSYEPFTVSVSRAEFMVKSDDGIEQTLTITSGQRTAQPLDFEIGKIKLTLLTYQTGEGVRLDPDYFQIVAR